MYFCYHCKEPICFSDEYISKTGKSIPLDSRTKRPHSCTRSVLTHASTHTPTHPPIYAPPKRSVAYTPFTNDRIPTQKIKHFKGTEEEFQKKWK
jgi:hypothetical protein